MRKKRKGKGGGRRNEGGWRQRPLCGDEQHKAAEMGDSEVF